MEHLTVHVLTKWCCSEGNHGLNSALGRCSTVLCTQRASPRVWEAKWNPVWLGAEEISHWSFSADVSHPVHPSRCHIAFYFSLHFDDTLADTMSTTCSSHVLGRKEHFSNGGFLSHNQRSEGTSYISRGALFPPPRLSAEVCNFTLPTSNSQTEGECMSSFGHFGPISLSPTCKNSYPWGYLEWCMAKILPPTSKLSSLTIKKQQEAQTTMGKDKGRNESKRSRRER